jgi:VanZ family protein
MVLIVVTSILSLSIEQGSVSQSRTYKIAEYIAREGKKPVDMDFEMMNYYIRKGAHFFEYMILAFLMSLAITDSRRGAIKQSIRILMLCIIVACFDEWIQTFITGRAGSIKDVILDSFGVLIGITIYRLVFMVFERFRYIILLVINHYIKKEI